MKKLSQSSSLKAGLLAASLAAVACGTTSCGARSELYVGSDTKQIDECASHADPDFDGMLDMIHSPETPDELCELTKKFQQQILCYLDQPWETKVKQYASSEFVSGGFRNISNYYTTSDLPGEINCFDDQVDEEYESWTTCSYIVPGGYIGFGEAKKGLEINHYPDNAHIFVTFELDNYANTYGQGSNSLAFEKPSSSTDDTETNVSAVTGNETMSLKKRATCTSDFSAVYENISAQIKAITTDVTYRPDNYDY